MKKWMILLLCIFVLLGCEKKEEVVSLEKDSMFYQIASPYKARVGNYTLSSYDKENVENLLTRLSQKYYKTNNSLLEEGQYLDNVTLKEIITKLNEVEAITIGDVSLEPKFISSIYEQNFLATNGNLKGISLAIILNPKQTYISDGKTLSKIVDEETILNYGKEKANQLLQLLREKEQLKDTNIVIGLYLESTSYLKGKMVYIGKSDGNKISLEQVNYRYEIMDSNIVMESDINHYNHVLAIKNELAIFPNVFVNAKGLYHKDTLEELELSISSSNFKQSEIIAISEDIMKQISSFDNNILVKVCFKSGQETKAIINENKLILLEG